MTEQEIAHLRALIEKATPTPWGMIEPIEGIGYIDMAEHRPNNGMLATCYNSVDDAALIVAAVNNVAALCDEVERLREALEVYADKSNWLDTDDEFLSSFCTDDFDWGWQAARKALGKDE